MTAASAALFRLAGQRGCSPGGCDATHLALVGPLGGISRLRALPRLDSETRTPHWQNYPGRQYGAGSFAVGLEASALRRSKGYGAEVNHGQENRRVQPAGVNVLRRRCGSLSGLGWTGDFCGEYLGSSRMPTEAVSSQLRAFVLCTACDGGHILGSSSAVINVQSFGSLWRKPRLKGERA